MKTPVVYVLFNRPEHTRETFAAIRAYRPAQLFLVADGPRDRHPSDAARCREARGVVERIDWPCAVTRDYSPVNLGAGRRVSTGVTAALAAVDRVIVLEDDCLASADFFTLCDDLLERYADEPSIWTIGANSYQPEFRRGGASYYVSKYPDTWGWATWRRAWRHYDHDLSFLRAWQQSPAWHEAFPTSSERRYYRKVFDLALRGRVDAWDFQWVACLAHGGGLSIRPNANLVRNIGLGAGGTHTRDAEARMGYGLTPLGPIDHPPSLERNVEADEYERLVLRPREHPGLAARLRHHLSRLVGARS